MTDVGISVGIIPDDSGARVIKRSLDDIKTYGQRANDNLKQFNTTLRQTVQNTDLLSRAFAGFFAAYGAREIIRIADQYTLLNARLKTIAGSTQEASRMMQDLRRVSNETGSEIATSLSILQRLSFVRNEIKASNNEMLAFTETVTKLGAASGASQEAMKAGLTQLGQALSSQYTRAEEFNSIMENIPGVGKAIADQLGVTTGQLRLLVVEGKLLSSDVFAAILNQTEETRKAFEEMPKTAEQGFAQLKNSLSQIIDQLNTATGGTNALGAAMRGLGDGAKMVYDGLATAFDFLVAGIQEGVNLIDIALNKVKGTINDISRFIPGYDGTNFNMASTLEPGSIFAQANAARKARESSLFVDPFSASATPEQRKISQDYAKIAAGLGGDKEAARKAAAEAKRQQKELESAINGSRTEMEKLNDEITHLEKLKGVAKTAEQVELLNRGIRNTQAEIDKLTLKAELDSPLAKGFAAVADEIQDGFKDAFKGAFDGGGSLFKKMADGIKATFKSLLLDLAYQAAVRPIVISVLGGIGSGLGLSSAATGSILGTSGSGGASGGIGALSNGLSLLSMGKSLLAGGSITAGLGTFAGQASAALGGSFATNLAVQKFVTQAGSLANIGGGFAGSLGANLLGLGNKNAVVNAGSGIAGSLIGQAVIPVPFLGAAIGGFAGTALGGLFGGGKPSDKSQTGIINFETLAETRGGQTGKKYSQQNADTINTLLNTISGVLKTVQSVGGSATGSASITVGNRDGLRYNGQNFGYNSTAFTNAIFGDLKNSISGLNSTFKTILDKVGVTNSDNLANAFAFGQSYLDTINSADTAKVLADSIKALDDNMAALLKTASELGLPLDEYTKALQKQKDASIGLLKAQAAGFGSFEDMTRAFDSFFNGQALGSNSSLTPMGKLQAAQNAFGGLLTKAQGGDLSVTPDLLNAANSLLEQGRGVYASGTDFSNLEGFVRSSVQGIASQTGYSGQNVAYNIVTTNQQLVAGNNELVKAVQDMKAEIYRLNNKITVLAAA